MTLVNATELLRSHVDQAIEALELTDKDAAAVKLARQYADLIDHAHQEGDRADRGWALRWIGPLLTDLLCELGATPAARARVKKGDTPRDAAPNRLALLRQASATQNRR